MRRTEGIGIALLVALSVVPAAAEDWCHPRGDCRNTGVTKNHGPKRRPHVIWSREEPSDIMGPAAVKGGWVYYAVGSRLLRARARASGREGWGKEVKQAVLAAPSIDGEFLYVGGQDGVHYCLRLEDATEPGGACLVADGPILAAAAVAPPRWFEGGTDGFFYAIATEESRLLWRREIGPTSLAAALGRRAVFAVNDAGTLYALDPKRGTRRWKLETKQSPLCAPILGKHDLFLATRDTLLRVDPKTGKQTGTYATPGLCAAPVLWKETLYYPTDHGEIVALDLQRGEPRTRIKPDKSAPAIATPLVLAHGILFGCAEATLFAVDPKKNKLLWTWKAPAVLTPPAVCDKGIYVGAGRTFYLLRYK